MRSWRDPKGRSRSRPTPMATKSGSTSHSDFTESSRWILQRMEACVYEHGRLGGAGRRTRTTFIYYNSEFRQGRWHPARPDSCTVKRTLTGVSVRLREVCLVLAGMRILGKQKHGAEDSRRSVCRSVFLSRNESLGNPVRPEPADLELGPDLHDVQSRPAESGAGLQYFCRLSLTCSQDS